MILDLDLIFASKINHDFQSRSQTTKKIKKQTGKNKARGREKGHGQSKV